MQCRLVEPKAESVNSGDCYVLVTPDKIINWVGDYCNVIEKAKVSGGHFLVGSMFLKAFIIHVYRVNFEKLTAGRISILEINITGKDINICFSSCYDQK